MIKPEEMGDPKIGVMQLVQDLQWKCRVKNAFIRNIVSILDSDLEEKDFSDEMKLEGMVGKLCDTLEELSKDRGEWKRKALLAIAFGPKNPIPLLGMFVCGVICGFLVRRFVG